MNVTCTLDQLGQALEVGSELVQVTGIEDGTGDLVTFAVNRNAYVVACGELLQGEGEVPFEVPVSMVMFRQPLKKIRVTLTSSTTTRMIDRYLPSNYRIVGADDSHVFIEGHDHAGWTSQYVIDRLASGLIWGAEVEYETEAGVHGEPAG